jgi:hypothetical protein
VTTQKEHIAALEAELAELRERVERVREYWYPWPGHPAGELCGVAARTLDGEHFALVQYSDVSPARAWTGDTWTPLCLSREASYRYTRDEAEELGPKLAVDSAAEHVPADEEGEDPTFARAGRIIQASRTAVDEFTAEPFDRIYARLGVAS